MIGLLPRSGMAYPEFATDRIYFLLSPCLHLFVRQVAFCHSGYVYRAQHTRGERASRFFRPLTRRAKFNTDRYSYTVLLSLTPALVFHINDTTRYKSNRFIYQCRRSHTLSQQVGNVVVVDLSAEVSLPFWSSVHAPWSQWKIKWVRSQSSSSWFM